MSGADEIPYRAPPPDEPGMASVGFAPVRAVGQSVCGVRIMLKSFRVMVDRSGEPVAFVEVRVPGAVQAVQAFRQAISDARKGRVRP